MYSLRPDSAASALSAVSSGGAISSSKPLPTRPSSMSACAGRLCRGPRRLRRRVVEGYG